MTSLRKLKINNELILISLLTLAYLFNLLPYLKTKFWLDELHSLVVIKFSYAKLLSHVYHADVHPPLYMLIAKFFSSFASYDPYFSRLISMFFGVCSFITSLRIATRFINLKVAYFTGLLMILSPYFIYYSHEIRHYSLFSFLSVLSTWYFLNLKKNDYGKKRYIMTSIALLYTHYLGVLVLASHLILIFIQKVEKANLKKILFSHLLIGAASIPLILLFIKQTQISIILNWIPPFSIDSLRELRDTYFYFPNYENILMLGFVLLTLYYIYKNRKNLNNLILLITLSIFPILSIILVSLTIRQFFVTRYFQPSFIFASMLISLLITDFLQNFPKKVQALLVLLISLTLFSISNTRQGVNLAYRDWNSDWPLIAKEIEKIAKDDYQIVISPFWLEARYLYFSSEKPNIRSVDLPGDRFLIDRFPLIAYVQSKLFTGGVTFKDYRDNVFSKYEIIEERSVDQFLIYMLKKRPAN